MWKRFFGSKNDSSESTKQKESEQGNSLTASEEKATNAMKDIQDTIEDLNKKYMLWSICSVELIVYRRLLQQIHRLQKHCVEKERELMIQVLLTCFFEV